MWNTFVRCSLLMDIPWRVVASSLTLAAAENPVYESQRGNRIGHLVATAARDLTSAVVVITMYLQDRGEIMKAKIVRIGNSKGIRLPKPLLEQVGLVDEVDLEVRDGELVISPADSVRAGWREAAIFLAKRKEDELLDIPILTRFDAEEWEW